MSTENKPNAQAPDAVPSTPTKPSAAGGFFRIIIPALLAAGAAYGGTRAAAARTPGAAVSREAGDHAGASRQPGPTVPLEPFLVTLVDANRKAHPMKMSLAVEFSAGTPDTLKTYTPRIRDAVLAYLRTVTHEQVIDTAHVDKMRAELLERIRSSGATTAEWVLVTDFVVQ